jgi:predicted NodU family carbamoyl transferase
MAEDFIELYVTLGHNSSAVMSRNGVVVRGYEQERLDRRKNSSAYPKEAIDAALGRDIGCDSISVSHWFDHFDLASLQADKYLNHSHLSSVCSHVTSLSPQLTHHDAHARSAVGFARMQKVTGPLRVLVVDGFGNRQECFSAYDVGADQSLTRVHRTYGYMQSLGLMYQYTTGFLGLKPNQDEYKLLGYEAHVTEHLSRGQAMEVHAIVSEAGRRHARQMMDSTFALPTVDSLIDYEALKQANDRWTLLAFSWLELVNGRCIPTPKGNRACVAFCAQTFLESAVVELIDLLPAPAGDATMVLTGGSFYNVKVNRRVQTHTGRRCFSHPLAGDQGAAMGLAQDPRLLFELDIGARRLGQAPAGGVLTVSQEKWPDVVADMLHSGRVVNVVRGGMEFGPRALCDTTTFALPTLRNVALINSLNERDEAMPMAPVMTRAAAESLLDNTELEAIKGSDQFMITTCAFKDSPSGDLLGVAHSDPILELWTARPQVTDDLQVKRLLDTTAHGVLINTSFNYHGEPIVYSFDDAVRTHSMQVFRAKSLGLKEPVTVVVRP